MVLKLFQFCIFLTVILHHSDTAAIEDKATDENTQGGLNTINEFQDLRQKWRSQLVSDEYDETNPFATNYVQQLSEKAEQLYQTLNKETDRDDLWTPVHEGKNPVELTEQFKKLHILTLAYGTKGTRYYKDSNIRSAVISGLDFMVTKKKYNGLTYYGNWWEWQVGVTEKFTEIIMIIYDELTYEQRQQYTKIINSYVPSSRRLLGSFYQSDESATVSFVSTYCRIGLAKTFLALGILQKDSEKIKEAAGCVTYVMHMVAAQRTSNNGYDNGPFRAFQHDLLYNIWQILSMIQDNRFRINSEMVEAFVEHMTEVLLPLMYRGEIIPPVLERAVTRYNNSATYTSFNLLLVSKYASSTVKENIVNAVKYWQLNKPNYVGQPRNYKDLEMITSIVQDVTIRGDKMPFSGTKMYPDMNRFVQRTPSYMLALSMCSSSSFDTLHGENKRGWHTADGMMYLYNDDDVQFREAYWPTVDPYRLPGTTVDTIPLEKTSELTKLKDSREKWVGGVAKKNQAVIGMSLSQEGTFSMNLKAKKSWFVVDGQIVALGAGITGDTSASIETVVENRLLNDDHEYRVNTNYGQVLENENQTDVHWFILKSDQPTSIGYYFPNKETLHMVKEQRRGCYRDINELYPNDFMYTANYVKVTINHGQHPVNVKYAYVILPGINESELIRYHSDQPVTILKNSAKIQAVELKQYKYLGVNIWSETGGHIAGIKTDKPVSLMKQSNNNEDTYVVSDPSKSDTIVTVKIPRFSSIVELEDGITYDAIKHQFQINFMNANGASKQFTVKNQITNNNITQLAASEETE